MPRPASRAVACAAMVVGTACNARSADRAPLPRADLTRDVAITLIDDTTSVPFGSLMCTDTAESRALRCSHGLARRDSNDLLVTVRDRELQFSETGGEAPGGFRYIGTIGDTALHIVESYGHESYPVWYFISQKTGEYIIQSPRPAISPDGRRMASGGEGWDNCSEGSGAELEIWHFAPRLPSLELREITSDCAHVEKAWGAVELRWHGNDTLSFYREFYLRGADSVERKRQPGRAVRSGQQWRVEVDSTAP